MRNTSAAIRDIYRLGDCSSYSEVVEKATWLKDKDRFMCDDSPEWREDGWGYYAAPELIQALIVAFFHSGSSKHGYCESVDAFIRKLSPQLMSFLATAVRYNLRAYVSGGGQYRPSRTFSVANISARYKQLLGKFEEMDAEDSEMLDFIKKALRKELERLGHIKPLRPVQKPLRTGPTDPRAAEYRARLQASQRETREEEARAAGLFTQDNLGRNRGRSASPGDSGGRCSCMEASQAGRVSASARNKSISANTYTDQGQNASGGREPDGDEEMTDIDAEGDQAECEGEDAGEGGDAEGE